MIQNQFENNVKLSFSKTKSDVYYLFDQVQKLQKEVLNLKLDNKELKETITSLQNIQEYEVVASEKGKKLHNSSCVFAKKINPLNKLVFNSVYDGITSGYEVCDCLTN